MPCGDLPLRSKIVLVTGGGSGINLSFVKLAVQHEALGVVIGDLKLGAEAQIFVIENASRLVFAECDVTKRKDLEDLVKTSVSTFGDVPDVYIAGAGVFEPAWSNWWDDTEGDRYAELDINVTHALKFSRIAMRSLLSKRKRGVVLITSSLAGYKGILGAPMYCASKHAIIGFVRSMAELDQVENIKIVAVAPGLVQTPLWTERPATMAQFGYKPQLAVTPDFVAEKMIDLVISGEHEGGTCLQVAASGVRTMGTWNIPAPAGSDTPVPREMVEAAHAPLRTTIERDKRYQG